MAKPTLVAAVVTSLRATAVLMPTMRPLGVDERPAGVARRDRGVGLDQPVEGAELGDDRAVERRDDAERHRRVAVEVEGEADGQHLVAELRPPTSGRTSPARGRRGRCAAGRGRCRRRTRRARPSVGSVSPGRRTRIAVAPSTTWALVRISPSADEHDAGADGPPALEVGADRDDRRPDGVDDGAHRAAAAGEPPSTTTGGRASAAAAVDRHRRRRRRPTPISTPTSPATSAVAADGGDERPAPRRRPRPAGSAGAPGPRAQAAAAPASRCSTSPGGRTRRPSVTEPRSSSAAGRQRGR